MKLICHRVGLHANDNRTYWVPGKGYPARETKTMYFIRDEQGCERKVSKKTMALTGFTKECYATTFTKEQP